MEEVDIPCDDSDIYCSGSGSEESIASVDRSNLDPLLSSSTENLSKEETGSTSSSVYLEQRSDGLDSDSDVIPASDEEEDDVLSVSSPGDLASLLKESYFQLICDGSNTIFIEAMVLIFKFALR